MVLRAIQNSDYENQVVSLQLREILKKQAVHDMASVLS
jgi:hypothetical protein